MLTIEAEIAKYFFKKGIDPKEIDSEKLMKLEFPDRDEYFFDGDPILTDRDGVVTVEYKV